MATRRRSYPRWFVHGIALLAVGMTVFAAVASREHHQVENSRTEVLSQLVALEARGLQSSNRALAMQLALAAYRLAPTPQAHGALLDLTATELPTGLPKSPAQAPRALGDGGHILAVARPGDGRVRIYAVRTSRPKALATIPGQPGVTPDSVALSQSGRLLAIGESNGEVALWSLSSPARPARISTLHAGSRAVRELSFSPAATGLAATGSDHAVWVWSLSDAADPKLVTKLSGFTAGSTSPAFSTNNQTVFVGGSSGTVQVWGLDTQSGSPQQLGSSPLTGPTSAVTALTLSPDGDTLAVGTSDGHVWLWAAVAPARASVIATLNAARGPVTALAFSPTGNTLVAATDRQRLTFWSYQPYRAVDRICAAAGTPITAVQWSRYVPQAAYDPPCEGWRPSPRPSGPALRPAAAP